MTMQNATPPGWYYAAGDPPGTQRYWDGNTWQGGPQPVGTSPNFGGQSAAGASWGASLQPAAYGARFVAYLIDSLVVFAVMVVAVLFVVLGFLLSEALGLILLLGAFVGTFGFIIWQFYIVQGRTGQTIGKKQQGIALLGLNGEPIGGGRVFGRYFIGSLIDNFLMISTLFIFIDDNNQKLGDKVMDCNVYVAPSNLI